jgi:flagellar hook-associated protein 2
LGSDVAEVRRGSLANTSDGTTPITGSTAFGGIFGAGVQSGDTIRINGTTHAGNSVTSTFTIGDPATTTVADLLTKIRSTFDGEVSASIDDDGRLLVTDNEVGTSSLTVTLIEENEGGGTLNLGSIDVETEGRLAFEVTATNQDNRLELQHGGYGTRNGFTLAEDLTVLGLAQGEYQGTDVAGTIGGEAAQGFGRVLTGSASSDSVAGLSARVDLTPEELTAEGGERGQLSVVFGVARQLGDLLSGITDSYGGSLTNRVQAIDDTIEDLDNQVTSMESRIERYRTSLVSKFSAMEGIVSTLQSQGNFLTSQLSGTSSSKRN